MDMECVSDVFALFLRGSLPLKKILTNGSEAEGGGRREGVHQLHVQVPHSPG